ncbi:putative protein kinase domain-containing protein [Botrytis fragariae]|uniref:non-specific serine/threonine protein kinase n=1 Tax=Botrytis fragariae TaxID=1964551 RepID=A0A8H6AQ80_9HELO|nr:putative protein kinase domain-containing protein [Botrytis fragariae]KAF5871340.1 putative protein kinase domain-containing protein [Botrytis fragariae]
MIICIHSNGIDFGMGKSSDQKNTIPAITVPHNGSLERLDMERSPQSAHEHVSLKTYTRDRDPKEEFEIYKRLRKGNNSHPGFRHIRTALEVFTIPRTGGDHTCLVQKAMWESFRELKDRLPNHYFTEKILKGALKPLFLALDHLHAKCKLVHTDIKADNTLSEIEDKSILDAFTEAEMNSPSPRKVIDGVTVYSSRRFDVPRIFGDSVFIDFGSAVRGAMIWDLSEGRHMFHGEDSDGKGYSTRAHLAEIIGMLGPPPMDFLERGIRTPEFFDKQGDWIAEMTIARDVELEKMEVRLQGRNKEIFLNMMSGMLQWRPEDRKSSRQLADDPWINEIHIT